jgi:hypothetical protein
MRPDDFRRIALSTPQSNEVYRRGYSHFRVERKTFASLEGPGDIEATINLTPEQRQRFVDAVPNAFAAVAGGWGRLGSTRVLLPIVTQAMLKCALGAAWGNVAPKALLSQMGEPPDCDPRSDEYQVMVRRQADAPSMWQWEVYCHDRPLPARLQGSGFKSGTSANAAGGVALKDFLDALDREQKKQT